MSSQPLDKQPTVMPPRSGWKKWLRRVVFLVLLVGLFSTLLLVGGRARNGSAGKSELARVQQQLDDLEPGWRLEQMEAARVATFPLPESNSAEIISKAEALIPRSSPAKLEVVYGDALLPPRVPSAKWHATPAANFRPLDSHIEEVREELVAQEGALEIARKLKDFPRGGWTIVYAEPAAITPLVHLQLVGLVSTLLMVDAEMALLDRDLPRWLGSMVAVVNAGRSIGDEWLGWSQLQRSAVMLLAARGVDQALAWVELPDEHLKRVQEMLAEEDRRPSSLPLVIRGERAMWSEAFDVWKSGRWGAPPNPTNANTPGGSMFGLATGKPEGIEERLANWWHRGSLDTDHAKYLELVTEFAKECTGSHERQMAACERLDSEKKKLNLLDFPERLQFLGTRRFLPSAKRFVFDTSLHAGLRCTIAAVACERFRLRHGRWPKALSEIPPEILPSVPLDPFDDHPLRLVPTEDGVKVHSIGTVGEQKSEIATRIWNPSERSKPTPPGMQKP